MRVVLDTNVFVSMMLGGRIAKIHDAWKAGKFTLIVSDSILSEYLDVLSRPKFHLDADIISIALGWIQRKAEFVIPTKSIEAIPDDPADNKFPEAALAAKAIYVISGDSHLLGLKTFRGISILTAREFIEQLKII